MGEVKAISEGCLEPANHRDSAVLSRLANHGESAEHPPWSIASWRSQHLWPRCGLLQSQLRLEAPPTTLYSVAEPSAGARAGAVPRSRYSDLAPWKSVFCRGPQKTTTFGPMVVGCRRPRGAEVFGPCGCEVSGPEWAEKVWLGASRPLVLRDPLSSPGLYVRILLVGGRSRSRNCSFRPTRAHLIPPSPKARVILECGSPHLGFC